MGEVLSLNKVYVTVYLTTIANTGDQFGVSPAIGLVLARGSITVSLLMSFNKEVTALEYQINIYSENVHKVMHYSQKLPTSLHSESITLCLAEPQREKY